MAAGGAQADVGRFREFPCLRGLECRAACRLQWRVACGGAMRSELEFWLCHLVKVGDFREVTYPLFEP